jgi:hypothetical protein
MSRSTKKRRQWTKGLKSDSLGPTGATIEEPAAVLGSSISSINTSISALMAALRKPVASHMLPGLGGLVTSVL